MTVSLNVYQRQEVLIWDIQSNLQQKKHISVQTLCDIVNLSHQGPETLKERCELLIAHKCEVEKRMEEMQQHLEKVAHKIDHYTKEYEEYQLENKQ